MPARRSATSKLAVPGGGENYVDKQQKEEQRNLKPVRPKIAEQNPQKRCDSHGALIICLGPSIVNVLTYLDRRFEISNLKFAICILHAWLSSESILLLKNGTRSTISSSVIS